MRKTKNFNIQVPELGDVPDITQVSNAIQDLEDALAGTLEIMDASIQGSRLTLKSVSRQTKRTKYYDGMSMRFLCPQTITANTLKTVVVDDLPQQVITVAFDIIAGEYVDITYRGTSFTAHPVMIQKSESIDSNSNETVATSKAVKKINDKVNNEVSELNKDKVSKSGDTMTGRLTFEYNSQKLRIGTNEWGGLIGGPANSQYLEMSKTGTISMRTPKDIKLISESGETAISANNLKTQSKEIVAAINELNNGKEPAFSKNSGFNLDKTDNATNDTNKLFTAKGAYNLKNEVDTKVSKSGDTMTGRLTVRADVNVWAPISKQPAFMISDENGNNKSGYFVDTDSSIVLKNYTSGKFISLQPNGDAIFKANNLKTSSKEVITAINELRNRLDSLNICPYNVGDVYITTKSGDPSAIWSGTSWKRIEGKFLLATSGGGATQQTGGSSSVTLSVNNMPSHNHSAAQSSHSHTQPAHTHTLNTGMNDNGKYHDQGDAKGHIGPGWSVKRRDLDGWINSAGGDNTGSAQPSISVGNTGGGQAFSIMPPYFTVHVWVRTK